jgi:hypothetical protein
MYTQEEYVPVLARSTSFLHVKKAGPRVELYAATASKLDTVAEKSAKPQSAGQVYAGDLAGIISKKLSCKREVYNRMARALGGWARLITYDQTSLGEWQKVKMNM